MFDLNLCRYAGSTGNNTSIFERWECGYKIDYINQFDGFRLYDEAFLNVLQKLDESLLYLRGIIGEIGFQRSEVKYTQEKQKQGKTKFNFLKLYDLAMLGITSYSKIIMRLETLLGFGIAFISLFIAGCTFIYKLFNWVSYPIGNAAISMGVFFLGAVQIFFIGILGEYILSINSRVIRRPLVIEEKRINFDERAETAKESAHHGTE